MARRSHTKSRRGCRTCKRRHVRCDEASPQCSQCTKQGVRCDYQDQDVVFPWSKPTGLTKITVQIMAGQKSTLSVSLRASSSFSEEDLKWINHLASISSGVGYNDPSQAVLWTQSIPRLATTHPFLMDALLGLSSVYAAWVSDSQALFARSYTYQGQSIKALQTAINNFSEDNADAILAASCLLSWQTTDEACWVGVVQGTSAIVRAMKPEWRPRSVFAPLLKDAAGYGERVWSKDLHSSAPPTNFGILASAEESIREAKLFVGDYEEARLSLQILSSFIEDVSGKLSKPGVVQQIEWLHPMRNWLFTRSQSFLRAVRTDLRAMVTAAHFYALAVIVEPLFKQIGAACGTFGVMGISDIAKTLLKKYDTITSAEFDHAFDLLQFPLAVASRFRDQGINFDLNEEIPLLNSRYSSSLSRYRALSLKISMLEKRGMLVPSSGVLEAPIAVETDRYNRSVFSSIRLME